MLKLWTITTNTFTETIRQPIYLILLLATFGVLVVDVPLAGWTMDTELHEGDNRMLVDLGLSTLMMSGLFIAAFSASGVLAREIEDKTVLTVVSKPVPRPTILAGKFLGVAAAATLAYYLSSLVFLMTVRHGTMPSAADKFDMVVIGFGVGALLLTLLTAVFCNYFFNWQFTSSAIAMAVILFTAAMGVIAFLGKTWTIIPFGQGIAPQLLLVVYLIWLAVMVMTALAITASSRLGQMPTLAVCVGLFLFLLLTDRLFGAYTQENLFARIAYWAIPNLAYFFTLDALTQQASITASHVGLVTLYGLCCVATILLIGMAIFQTREMENQSGSTTAPSMVNGLAWLMRLIALVTVLVGLAALGGHLSKSTVLASVACIVGGAAGWLLAGYLGAGARWAFFLLLFVVTVQLISSVVFVLVPRASFLNVDQRAANLMISAALAGYVLLMSLRRATRDHFARRRPALID